MYPKLKAGGEVGNVKQRGSCLNSNHLQSRPSGISLSLSAFFPFKFDSLIHYFRVDSVKLICLRTLTWFLIKLSHH